MAPDTPTLTVYCRPWCPDCRRALAWLDEHDIAYVEVDVDADPDARNRAASHNLGALHTPTFELGDDVCIDFRPERLKELLGL
ncbi:MAG: NrdH-redoxin [Actinobacteria bacterium HGW-Actinobacteria-7]|nr:MAG: NrdH-redoxin [Actinobacteria bacterium HGW-Actinobacteria-7]